MEKDHPRLLEMSHGWSRTHYLHSKSTVGSSTKLSQLLHRCWNTAWRHSCESHVPTETHPVSKKQRKENLCVDFSCKRLFPHYTIIMAIKTCFKIKKELNTPKQHVNSKHLRKDHFVADERTKSIHPWTFPGCITVACAIQPHTVAREALSALGKSLVRNSSLEKVTDIRQDCFHHLLSDLLHWSKVRLWLFVKDTHCKTRAESNGERRELGERDGETQSIINCSIKQRWKSRVAERRAKAHQASHTRL